MSVIVWYVFRSQVGIFGLGSSGKVSEFRCTYMLEVKFATNIEKKLSNGRTYVSSFESHTTSEKTSAEDIYIEISI